MEFIKSSDKDSFLYKELELTKKSLQGVMQASHPWGRVLDDVRENFAWDFEEATTMRIVQNKKKFQGEIKSL